MAASLPFFAMPGQQIVRQLPSFPASSAAAGGAFRTEKVDVAQQTTLRSSYSGGGGRARGIGGRRARPRSGQAGDKTVRRELRVVPSQPARAQQGALSPHALSLSATTLFQWIELGLGDDLLSRIGRQRKTRCGEIHSQDRGFARSLATATGAGSGALGPHSPLAEPRAAKSPQACHLFDLCWQAS